MEYIIWIVIGYLSGSILSGYLVPKYLAGVDVVALSDDHNPGAYNAFKYAGKKIGYLVVLCEVMKGFLPVFLSSFFVDKTKILYAFVIFAPIVGHCFSIFDNFKGGKALGISNGVLLGLLPNWIPLVSLISLYIIFSKVIVINPHFIRIIITYTLVCIISYYFCYSEVVYIGILLMSALVICKHLKRGFRNFKITIPIMDKSDN